MVHAVSAARVAALVRDFDRTPAYAGLARALRLAIGDGRIGSDVRLPAERLLTAELGLSRTTVTRAYAALRDSGYATARQGAGTFTRVPGPARSPDRALTPRVDGDAIDLNCAAATAPPGVAEAYADALGSLPAYLAGHGYYPAGLPHLQELIARRYEEQGLPTDPEQVLIVPGALAGAVIAAHTVLQRGRRVLVESPTYPNAVAALRRAGGRVVASPVDPERYDLDALVSTLRQTRPTLAYLIPDFHNPTGHLMEAEARQRVATELDRLGVRAVIDESHRDLLLEDRPLPAPFATVSPSAITIGSSSKWLWGGLRIGWLRLPHDLVAGCVETRLSLDLGSPVLEQLTLARLLEDPDPVRAWHVERLREQCNALTGALTTLLPDLTFRLPSGGMSLWCELPEAASSALTVAAERHGVVLVPGPVFAVDGGMDRFVRIPYARPAAELVTAVERIAVAWNDVRAEGRSAQRPAPRRVTVA